MRKKLPATALFRKIDKKVIASLSSLAKKSGNDEPRVTGRDPVRQHVFISLCALLLSPLACYNMGKSPMKSGIFRV